MTMQFSQWFAVSTVKQGAEGWYRFFSDGNSRGVEIAHAASMTPAALHEITESVGFGVYARAPRRRPPMPQMGERVTAFRWLRSGSR